MSRSLLPARRDGGQVLVLFALAATALIAMVGLVLDGGDTFAQRRDQQNAADVAALAGATAYLNASGSVADHQAAAQAAATAAATRNGYTTGGATTVTVGIELASAGASVQVDITAPHRNGFAGKLGFTEWPVSVTATAKGGTVDTAAGAAPWIMSVGAFNADGSPKYDEDNPKWFGLPPGNDNSDYPVTGDDMTWTDFNGADNVNANEVARIIADETEISATMDENQYIGQHNSGLRAGLFDDVQAYLLGQDVPVPITGPCPTGSGHADGCFKGWAMFHVLGATGGDTKQIRGYFRADFVSQPLSVGACTEAQQAAGTCGVVNANPFGGYQVRLTH